MKWPTCYECNEDLFECGGCPNCDGCDGLNCMIVDEEDDE